MYLTKQDEGRVVYFVKNDHKEFIGVGYGIIDADSVFEYDKKVVVDYLTTPDFRYINGVSIKDFDTTRMMKLPKKWDNVMELYKLEDVFPDGFEDRLDKINLKDPDSVRKAYKEGVLILQRDSHRLLYKIDVYVSRDGYRVFKTAKSVYELSPTHSTYNFDQVYATYQEALDAVNTEKAELKRQAELSDEEWSIEQITKTLNHWQSIYKISDEQKSHILNELLSYKNITDLEVRLCNGMIQWKYWKNKRWNNLNMT